MLADLLTDKAVRGKLNTVKFVKDFRLLLKSWGNILIFCAEKLQKNTFITNFHKLCIIVWVKGKYKHQICEFRCRDLN